MIFESGDHIVFAGDSVTDMGRFRPVAEGFDDQFGQSYVHVIENMLTVFYPERIIRVTNAGISGNTSRDLLGRFQEDVVDLTPDWVSICIGINDVWRQFDCPMLPKACVLPEEYESNLRAMITAVKDSVKGIFILSPYIMEPNRSDPMRARMDEYVAICEKLAREYHCTFVNFQKMYEEFCQTVNSARIAWDRIHPNMRGAMLMAHTFLQQCGFQYSTSDGKASAE